MDGKLIFMAVRLKKNLIHKNKAARIKSKLAKKFSDSKAGKNSSTKKPAKTTKKTTKKTKTSTKKK